MKKNLKNFKILIGNLLSGYELLCLNEDLHDEVKGNYYYNNNFKEIWNIILVSLEIRFWLELAKIFDKPNRRFKNISINDFFDHKLKFKGFLRKINKVIKLRHKAIAHTDQKTARNFRKFLKKLGLKRTDARPLFEKTIDVLDKFGDQYKYKNLKLSFEEAKLRIQDKVEKFIKYSDREARP